MSDWEEDSPPTISMAPQNFDNFSRRSNTSNDSNSRNYGRNVERRVYNRQDPSRNKNDSRTSRYHNDSSAFPPRRPDSNYRSSNNFNDHSRNWYDSRFPRNDSSSYERNVSSSEGHANNAPIDWKAAYEECKKAQEIKWSKCPKLLKEFYKEHPDVRDMSNEEVAEIRAMNNNTTVLRVFEDKNNELAPIPNPVTKFEQCFSEYPDLLDEIKKQGFEKPSPIQSQAWPILLKGEDLIGIAQTGTGKTLAFLLPAMIHTEMQPIPRGKRGGPNVLVFAPTRELALQIEKEIGKYKFRDMKSICVYGGGDIKNQIKNTEEGVEIVIATPGRLNDLVQRGVIDVTTITYLVLDEADRMLDMGFEPQIRKILLDIRPDRQTVMTSATWPSSVRQLAEKYMKNPIQVMVGSLDLAAVHTVEQCIEMIEEEAKYDRLMEIINSLRADDKIVVFIGKKSQCAHISSELSMKYINCTSMHGDMEQSDREQSLDDIKSSKSRILLATDLASRGIDIDDITMVINYDFPGDIESYVHRVGRTGRAGRTGKSISFFTRRDWANAKPLIGILEEANQTVPSELIEMAQRFEHKKERQFNERGGGDRRNNRNFGRRY